ncbi:VOC family protein [Kluyveromyces lactis]|uniref:KLLA0C09218p n=1 Tax=Kluyveromyces lactis (strain ATCC 8585 / CBS 2359 / DSM 70799 / NBRC 1267 / NRRL Y-1140 / WM37) TaxID=284590 RepID=Q6CTX9_KLULA|nr:uncharacterized protein KLLA0_C09218g [Kluyveromyces lactis]CAH01461.1 KLLA0C09218p [Kluyveromyces lactis]|eukprot:XP_452610.1 uncharacterized protein KLLA0_C09218g [Kluyveromyces lactis]
MYISTALFASQELYNLIPLNSNFVVAIGKSLSSFSENQTISYTAIMFSHVTFGSNDLEKARKFYDAVLGVIGVAPAQDDSDGNGHKRLFYAKGDFFLLVTQPINDQAATPGNGYTIGFKCDSEEEVTKFHDVAVANGGTSIEDAPGYRPSGLFLSYVRDVDGNKLCALYQPPK